jgi:hypothetical protein
VLRHTYRFADAIAVLAQAVRDGDAASTMDVLRASRDDVLWLDRPIAPASGLRDRLWPSA